MGRIGQSAHGGEPDLRITHPGDCNGTNLGWHGPNRARSADTGPPLSVDPRIAA